MINVECERMRHPSNEGGHEGPSQENSSMWTRSAENRRPTPTTPPTRRPDTTTKESRRNEYFCSAEPGPGQVVSGVNCALRDGARAPAAFAATRAGDAYAQPACSSQSPQSFRSPECCRPLPIAQARCQRKIPPGRRGMLKGKAVLGLVSLVLSALGCGSSNSSALDRGNSGGGHAGTSTPTTGSGAGGTVDSPPPSPIPSGAAGAAGATGAAGAAGAGVGGAGGGVACAGDPLTRCTGTMSGPWCTETFAAGGLTFFAGLWANRPTTSGSLVASFRPTAPRRDSGCSRISTAAPGRSRSGRTCRIFSACGARRPTTSGSSAERQRISLEWKRADAGPRTGRDDSQIRERQLEQRRVGRRRRHLPLERQRLGAVVREHG